MADEKISQLTDGSPAQASDLFVVARGSSNFKIPASKVTAAVPTCHVRRTTNQAIANNTETALSFDTKDWDTDSMIDLVGHPTRITFNTAGVYQITGGSFWATASDTAYRTLVIVWNGDTTNNELGEHLHAASGSGNSTAQTVSTLWKFAVNDYVELYVQQGSGGSLNINSGSKLYEAAFFGAHLVSAT